MAAFMLSDRTLAPPGLGRVVSVTGSVVTIECFDELTTCGFGLRPIAPRSLTALSCDRVSRRRKPMTQPRRVVP